MLHSATAGTSKAEKNQAEQRKKPPEPNQILLQKVNDTVCETLLECQIKQLPVDILALCECEGMHTMSYRQAGDALFPIFMQTHAAAGTSAVAIRMDGEDYIFYDSTVPRPEQRFTIAREAGHCLLNHFTAGQYAQETIDREAEQFALWLLAPPCVLCGLRVQNAKEIVRYCDIPQTEAELQMQYLNGVYRQEKEQKKNQGSGRKCLTALEQAVYMQFQPFITETNADSE